MIADVLSNAINQINAFRKAGHYRDFHDELYVVVAFMDALREALDLPPDAFGTPRAAQLQAVIREALALAHRLEDLQERVGDDAAWAQAVQRFEDEDAPGRPC